MDPLNISGNESNEIIDSTSTNILDLKKDKNIYQQRSGKSDSSDESDSSTLHSYSSDCSDYSSDEEKTFPKKNNSVKTKGEIDLNDLPFIEELQISILETELNKLGKIHSIVGKQVVIKSEKNLKPLDLDSVLFLSHDKPLGKIFDVYGQVVEPFYCVLFNSEEEIASKNIVLDLEVFYAPEKDNITTYVFVDELQNQKGSDASWTDNNEPPEEHLDYSDDEQEKAAKQKRLAKNRKRNIDELSIIDTPIESSTINSKFSEVPKMPHLKFSKRYNTPPFYRPQRNLGEEYTNQGFSSNLSQNQFNQKLPFTQMSNNFSTSQPVMLPINSFSQQTLQNSTYSQSNAISINLSHSTPTSCLYQPAMNSLESYLPPHSSRSVDSLDSNHAFNSPSSMVTSSPTFSPGPFYSSSFGLKNSNSMSLPLPPLNVIRNIPPPPFQPPKPPLQLAQPPPFLQSPPLIQLPRPSLELSRPQLLSPRPPLMLSPSRLWSSQSSMVRSSWLSFPLPPPPPPL